MFGGVVSVPDTSGDMTAKAIPIASINGVTTGSVSVPAADVCQCSLTGYTTFLAETATIRVWVVPGADLNDNATWPTAAQVVTNGIPCKLDIPISIQDAAGSPYPDARLYFCATASGDGAGKLFVLS